MKPRQSSTTIDRIKKLVRERDGLKCVRCSKTNEEHVAECGRQLQVHRKTPGSVYAPDGCETVCRKCHGPLPERKPGESDFALGIHEQVRVRLDIAEKEHEELRVLAARSGLSMAKYCELLVLEAVRKKRVLKAEDKEKK